MRKTDFITSAAFFFILLLGQLIYISKGNGFSYFFAVEYGNIATSIYNGNGFSDPFGTPTGTTSWMPPLLVWLITFSFYLFGKTINAFLFLSILKFISLSVILYLIIRIFRLINVKINYLILLIIYGSYLALSPSRLFINVEDFWLPSLFIIIFLYKYLQLYYAINSNNLLLYFVVFLMPFTNPSYANAIILTVLVSLVLFPPLRAAGKLQIPFIHAGIKRSYLLGTKILFVFLLSISIWTIRNYVAFEEFIPTKSNFWFEFYLSNIEDPDGKLSRSAVYHNHPIYNKEASGAIREIGEIEWLDRYKAVSAEYLRENTFIFFGKIVNRMVNAFIFTENDNDFIKSTLLQNINKGDRSMLHKERLVFNDRWCFPGNHTDERKLKNLNLQQQNRIIDDWKNSKKNYLELKYSIPNLARGILTAIIPFAAILLLLFTKHKSKTLVWLATLIYFAYLAPFILVSHQYRYQNILIMLQILLVYLAVMLTRQRFFNKWYLPQSRTLDSSSRNRTPRN